MDICLSTVLSINLLLFIITIFRGSVQVMYAGTLLVMVMTLDTTCSTTNSDYIYMICLESMMSKICRTKTF